MVSHPLDSKRHLYEAITRHNYFPNQKEGARELPPCFSTLSYTPEIVELLSKIQEPKDEIIGNRKKLGYDQVVYSLTRHNNVPRMLALPHPKAYALLAKAINENWDEINYIFNNERSVIKPSQHADGRMLVMNYEGVTDKTDRSLGCGFGMKFVAHTDISSCFHSIYTHSIPWAIRGFDISKKSLGNKDQKHWSDELDIFQRKTKRNETQGIAIGPGTSTIIVEIVLGAVDKVLECGGFKFHRYIDDYICYCETYEEAQSFIQTLGIALRQYKLDINLYKTRISELPEPINDQWVTDLTLSQPNGNVNEDGVKIYSNKDVISFLDAAVRLNKSTPDGSVIKYAVSYLLRFVDEYSIKYLLDYSIYLAWHYPIIIPLLEMMFEFKEISPREYESQINALALESARQNRSDGMCWSIYFLNRYDLNATVEVFSEVFKTKDCMALLCLYENGVGDQHIIDFALRLFCSSVYERDQFWILLYQLYKDGKIQDPYGDGVFYLLKKHDVNFMANEKYMSKAQQYCDYINSPFLGFMGGEIEDFESWLKNNDKK